MFRLTYPHTFRNLLLRPYSHVQNKLHTLPVPYSSDLILMFRLTYPHTVCTLLLRPYYHVQTNLHLHCVYLILKLYSHVQTNLSTHCLYLTSETLFLCSDKRAHALPVTYSRDPNLMFRLIYPHCL